MSGPRLRGIGLVVEGANANSRVSERLCRQAFQSLISKHVGSGVRVTVFPAGGRGDALKDFRKALGTGEFDALVLLVDSETAVAEDHGPWRHVASRRDDRWNQPAGSDDDHLHFMCLSMESWVLADHDALREHFGGKIDITKIPKTGDVESRNDPLAILNKAMVKGEYRKVEDGFGVLSHTKPETIAERCPRFGKRFLDHVANKMT